MFPSLKNPKRRIIKSKSKSISFAPTLKQVQISSSNFKRSRPRQTIEKRLTELMILRKNSNKNSFLKKTQNTSHFLKRVHEAKRKRHKSLHSKNISNRARGKFSINFRVNNKEKENKNRGKSNFFNVFNFQGKNGENQINRPKNENLERLFKRYKVSKRDKKCLIYNSNQVDKNIESLIKFVDSKFYKAEEFIKKNILKSNFNIFFENIILYLVKIFMIYRGSKKSKSTTEKKEK